MLFNLPVLQEWPCPDLLQPQWMKLLHSLLSTQAVKDSLNPRGSGEINSPELLGRARPPTPDGSKPFPARPEPRITKLLQVNASPTLPGISHTPGTSHGPPEPNALVPASPRDPGKHPHRDCNGGLGPPGPSTPSGLGPVAFNKPW